MNRFTDVFYACHPSWDFSQRFAATTIATGFLNGFRQLGIRAHITRYGNILNDLETADRPLLILSYDEYSYLQNDVLAAIRDIPHIIWVNVWFDGMAEMAREGDSPDPTIPQDMVQKVLDSGAVFLFCNSPESFFSFYEGWLRSGQRLISVPLACDTEMYYPHPDNTQYSDIDVAYVSGYYNFRESAYQQFLYPYESQLATFGYREWPKAYRGYLPNEDEAILYQNAKVMPSIHEPFMWKTGALFERPFKIMGSGGLTIIDTRPAAKELFADEVLAASTVEEFHELMHLALTDETFNQEWRRREMKAVLARHTYRHRAETILRAFEKGQ